MGRTSAAAIVVVLRLSGAHREGGSVVGRSVETGVGARVAGIAGRVRCRGGRFCGSVSHGAAIGGWFGVIARRCVGFAGETARSREIAAEAEVTGAAA